GVRGALRSVRNAAAGRSESRPAPEPAVPQRPAPPRASLTDVVPRRTLVIIAVVAALALISTVLIVALNGNSDDSSGSNQGKDSSTASAGATAGEDAPGDGTGQSPAPDASAAGDGKGDTAATNGQGSGDSGSGSDPSGDSGGGKEGGGKKGSALPEGYAKVSDDRFHFSMAMPEGFHRTGIAGANSGGIFSEDGEFPRVQVDFNDSPTDDAVAAWQGLQSAVRGNSDNYKLRGIKKVDYNGYQTVADWEFERNQNGERIRVLNRGFKIDAKRGYSIMVSCEASEWNDSECETLRKTAFETFEPTA
ncbi:serine/threonine protein kinase, partial [Streptomyces sp. NPDC055039]